MLLTSKEANLFHNIGGIKIMRRMFSEKQIESLIQSTQKDVSTLVDSEGHERFIEGDIEFTNTGTCSKTYGKWSLSGSHLLVVLVIEGETDETIANGEIAVLSNLPEWIKDKIIVLYGNIIAPQTSYFYASDGTTQQINTLFNKRGNGQIDISTSSPTTTFTKDRLCRIVFDLLIDNE